MRLLRPLALLAVAAAVLALALEAAARVLGRAPTRSRIPTGRHLLVYDDACDFCTAAAAYLQLRVPALEAVGFRALPIEGVLESLDDAAIHASAHLVTPEGIEYHGGEAITRACRLVPGLEPVAYLDRPVLRGLRELGYRAIAGQRARVSRVLRIS
jgi:predicted DCC family thiol-disulfide oxidoreductase YuxK